MKSNAMKHGSSGLAGIILCIITCLVFKTNMLWSAEKAASIQISAVGDIMMGSTYPTPILPPDDGQTLFDQVKEVMKGSHIVLGNLEGPLVDTGLPYKCSKERKGQWGCFEFRTPTRYVHHLVAGGFSALNVSNNHSLDFGIDGLRSTIEILKKYGIAGVGGNDYGKFLIISKRVVVAGFSFIEMYDWPTILTIDRTAQIISDLKQTNDIVVVLFHGGAEGAGAMHVKDIPEKLGSENRGNVVRFARSVIDAGADVVIGSGPHVLRAMELYRGKLIAYSLGNFATYGRFNLKGPNGVSTILKLTIDETTGNFVSGRLIPVKLRDGGIPYFDEEGDSIGLIRMLSETDVPSPLQISEDGQIYPMKQKPQ
jgi:hypothetical protein